MLQRGDLITPTLGDRPWFEKPALLYWLMIASYKLFGVNEWAARLPSAVAGILTVVPVFLIGRRIELKATDELPKLGFWNAIACSTTLGLIVFSRAASFDIILTMTITWSLVCFFLHEIGTNEKRRRLWLAGFYAFIGISLLAKGFIGAVIPGGTVIAYYLLRRRMPDRSALVSIIWGVPLSLVVAASWYAPVIARHGNLFIDQFIWQHQFSRYVSNNYRHPGPFYYYLAILVPLTLPWTIFLIGGLARAASWTWRKSTHTDDPARKYIAFAFVWLLVPLLFFSFSSSKLPGYILPALPAATLLIGERLARVTSIRQSNAWKLKTTAAFCFVIAFVLPVMAWRWERQLINCGLLIAGFLALAALIAMFTNQRRSIGVIGLGAATICVVLVSLFCAAGSYADRESSKRLLQLADTRGHSQTVIYGLKLDDRSPEFYAAGRVTYLPNGEPYIYEGPGQLVNECLRRGGPVLSFVPLEGLYELHCAWAAQTEVIGDNGRVALVVVTPRSW